MPPAQISISTNTEHHVRAAHILSESLRELGYDHAYIGGFAWSLLGSRRATQDIDILIQPLPGQPPLLALWDDLMERSPHFAKANIKFYFVQQPNELLDGTENVIQGINNVLIETLMAGRMGLPAVASPTHQVEHMEFRIPILHPCILILTKLKRWTMNRTSTRPKTKAKRDTDWADIKYLVAWLSERTYKIEFSKYEGKSRGDLLLMARQVHHELMEEEDEDLIVKLEEVMYPVDWEDMIIIVLAPTVEDLTQTERDPRQTVGVPTPTVVVTTSSVDVPTPTVDDPAPTPEETAA